jgi:hypothetical protein
MAQDDKPVVPTPTELSAEQVQAIGGGDCWASDYLAAIANFKQAYEDLIAFASYVIERVAPP